MDIYDIALELEKLHESFDNPSFIVGIAIGISITFFYLVLFNFIPMISDFLVDLIMHIISAIRKRNSPPSGEDK